MAAFRSRHRHGGRWWGLGTTLAAAAVALFFVTVAGGAPKPPPTTPAGPYQVPSGPLSQAVGFAGNDGGTTNPNVNTDYSPAATVDPNATNQPTFDWNSLSGGTNPTYSGTVPYQNASGLTNGFQWLALTDDQKSTTDTGFAGGVKQDVNCAAIQGGSAPNKDDLKRAYVAAKTIGTGVNAHTYLELGWVRIPQNTTSASAHVAFEFNQGTTPPTACPAGSGGLIPRVAGDLLLVYDFTGGSTVPPTINVGRWVTSGACQIGSDSPPCWGPFTQLNASQAEADVDTGLSHICNSNLTPTGCGPGESDHNTANTAGTKYVLPFQTSDSLAPSTETLGTSEFGEATIDLTNSNIFPPGQCESFGQVEAVSRSSGDSGTAAMEDLVGPGTFNLSNCGTIKIIKHTDPRGTDQSFSYCTDVGQPATGGPTYSKAPDATTNAGCPTGTHTSFQLNDKGVAISAISAANPTQVTATAHGLTTGDTVTITGSDSTPSIDGSYTVTVTGANTFTIPVAVTTAGTKGTVALDTSASATNIETITNVQPGNYKVSEIVPSGWTLENLSCSPNDNTLSSFGVRNGTTSEADITLAAEGVVTCTYQNQPTVGAILVTKQGKDKNCTGTSPGSPGNVPGSDPAVAIGTCTATNALVNLGSATFKVYKESNGTAGLQIGAGGDTLVDTKTTDTTGQVCFNALSFGSTAASQAYYVNESTAPPGYQTDDTGETPATSKAVTVNTSSKCSDTSTIPASQKKTFTDTPLSKIEVKFSSAAAPGVTTATITCYKEDGTTVITPDSGSTTGSDQSYSGLIPNSASNKNYSCTINVDP